MDKLNELLKPVWDVQREILLIWNYITVEEQCAIISRMDALFKNGIPFELKHDKEIYIHIFSMLAQVDVMACQVPMKFESKISSPDFQRRLRAQLLDEIFHVLLSIKVVNLLCSPYSLPPASAYNQSLETLCEVIRREECPEIALVLLNLIGEGIAEELVKCLDRCSFAPKIFDLILIDERRHVSDADLYLEIGLPDKKALSQKMQLIEEHLLALLFEYSVGMALSRVLGMDGMYDYFRSVDFKYKDQLNKLDLTPSKKWMSSMHVFSRVFKYGRQNFSMPVEIEMSSLRQLSMAQWRDPVDPTMTGQFNIDVTCLDFFNKKYPSETLTTLMLQTVSQLLVEYPEYQVYLRDKKLYQRQVARVGLVVKLPECGDHLGMITFQDCHTLTVQALSIRIKQVVAMMVYCYKKREQLEKKYPSLMSIPCNMLDSMSDPIYRPVLPTVPGVCLSNIGSSGYIQGISPLLSNEASKVTLFEVQRTPVWSTTSNTFEARDLLPVSVSVDHRIYGGNLPIPKIMAKTFQDVFQRMTPFNSIPLKVKAHAMLMEKMVDDLLTDNLEFGYLTLVTLQTMWPDYMCIDELLAGGGW